jgi:hypothetical protein
MNIKKIIRESIQKVIFENDEMCGTDEQFDAFMRWAMTDGNDYGFGDAAEKYTNDEDPSGLYMIAMQYGKQTGINPEIVFNMAKEAAEGIYGFAGDIFSNPIDTRDMEEN